MVKVLSTHIDDESLKQVAQDLDGYIKVVVDVKLGILAAGGARHVQGEELLLANGSHQKDLWGGGLDVDTGGIDFDSMINIRPDQANPSREVLNTAVRDKMTEIIKKILR